MNIYGVVQYIWDNYGLLFYEEKNNGVLMRVSGSYPENPNQLMIVRNLGRTLGAPYMLTSMRYPDITTMFNSHKKSFKDLLKYYESRINK